MKVRCPGCRRSIYETTDAYDPNRSANGAMVELIEPYRGFGWGKFENGQVGGKSVLASEMLCVMCGAPLAPSGKLKVIEEAETAAISDDAEMEVKSLTCKVCGKLCKSPLGLSSHMRVHAHAQ